MDVSVFTLENRRIEAYAKAGGELAILRDMLRRGGREWKEEADGAGNGEPPFPEKCVRLLYGPGGCLGPPPCGKTRAVVPLPLLAEYAGKFPAASFVTYGVGEAPADFTARNLSPIPGEGAVPWGIRFDLGGGGVVGRVCARGLKAEQVPSLLGAASCLLALGLHLAEVLERINRSPWQGAPGS